MGQKKTQGLVVLFHQTIIQPFSDGLSIFIAEANAVDLALDFERTCDTSN